MSNEQLCTSNLNARFRSRLFATMAALAISSTAAISEDAPWGYGPSNGPEHWGEVAPICAAGSEQSPIDLVEQTSTQAAVAPVVYNWKPFTPKLLNNGHTIEMGASGEGGDISIGDKSYDLLQIHFHHLSEHTFSGQHRDIETHLVHRSKQGDIVVVSITFVKGDENQLFQSIEPVLDDAGKMVPGTMEIDPNELLPTDQSAFRYKGSLTTPGCFEVVTWHVLQEPVTASSEQINGFSAVFPNNYRPVQDLGRRYVLFSD